MVRRILYLIVFSLTCPLVCHFTAQAQGFDIENFTPPAYGGLNQNWSVDQSNSGIIYIGNQAGLLVYDGSRWELYRHPDQLTIRSVLALSDSVIYTGSLDEFGVWKKISTGTLVYSSLVSDDIKPYLHNDEIWNIIKTDSVIFFQSFSGIFRYSDNVVSPLFTPFPLLFIHNIHNRVIGYASNTGLFEIFGDSAKMIRSDPFFNRYRIPVILEKDSDGMVLGTENNGLFLLQHGRIRPWQCEASDYLRESVLNKGLRTADGRYIFGTIKDGIIICDHNGKVINSINSASGLQHNTILGMHYNEKTGRLWLALNFGIDAIDLNSPYLFYYRNRETTGTVFTAKLFHGRLYLGTNQGLYVKRLDQPFSFDLYKNNFTLIKGSEGQVWKLFVHDNVLFCGHNSGTFIVEDTRIKRWISHVTGGWDMQLLHNNGNNYLLESTYTSLVLFEKTHDGIWEQSRIIDHFSEPIKYLEISNNNIVWASHEKKGVYKIKLSQDLNNIKSYSYYGVEKGFPSEYNCYVFSLNHVIVFGTPSGFYTYDEFNDSMVYDPGLNHSLDNPEGIRALTQVNDSLYWLSSQQGFTLFRLNDRGILILEKHPNYKLHISVPESNENVIALNDSLSMFPLSVGFAIYKLKRAQQASEDYPPNILLREVSTRNGKLSLYSPDENPVLLHFEKNNIHFRIASPGQHNCNVQFQFKLDGLQKTWEPPTSQPEITFNYLPAGHYVLMARAVTDCGTNSGIIRYPFVILTPWYLKYPAFVFYFFLLVLLIVMVRLFVRKKYNRKQLELERQHKEEQLRNDINYRVKQVATSTMEMLRKNQILTDIKNQLERVSGSGDIALNARIKKIIKIIDHSISNHQEWDIFAENFDYAFNDFLKRIKNEFPDLSSGDLQLCAFLRLNLSSKEIASMMNLTVRSVEIKRYRLRKKLGLTKDQKLVDFLIMF